jgi:hypothetical protein
MKNTSEMHAKFWSENLNGKDHSEDLGVDGNILKWILGRQGGKIGSGFIWFRTETSGGVL